MSDDRHARVKQLFLDACELPSEERATFLEQTCGDDAGLRREVCSLLRFHEEVDREDRESATEPMTVERVIGYRIVQRIGEGGMGVVYEAEQLEPVRRRVALKVIKAGMDTSQVVTRFESERQALAKMDHPNIARVLDAGATEQGRPFFAMEFIGGDPITAYCDRQRLATRERLELFIQVCEAVQHAHRKGIIHRDIKPSNVMVRILDGRAVPTIIDFGIAKAIEHRLTDESMQTAVGMMIGTPDYMSPEQAEMTGDVDTRTDVYSLGVLLYELLAGALPFEPSRSEKEGLDEIRRRIREEEPSRPSTRVRESDDATRQTALRRRTDPAGLTRQLRGDLDWITLRALEKDRRRRYPSPSELAADIKRHLHDEPVMASPPSRVYRARKFVRRNRVGVAAGCAVLVALIVGLTVATVGMVRAREAERAARHEAEKASKISRLLIGQFDDLNRSVPGHVVTLEQVLDRGLDRVESDLNEEPELQARLLGYLAGSYGSLGKPERARELAERSVTLCRENLPPHHPTLGHALGLLGDVVGAFGDLDRAQRLHEEALEIWRRAPMSDAVSLALGRTHQSLGAIRLRRGDLAEARSHLDRSEEILEQTGGTYRIHLAYTLTSQAILDTDFDLNHSAALPRLVRALELLESEFGPDHSQTWDVRFRLGQVHLRLGDSEAARQQFEQSLRLQADGSGDDSRSAAMSRTGLGSALAAQGANDAAREHLERAFAVLEETDGMSSPDTAWCAGALAVVYLRSGDVDGARRLLERSLNALEQAAEVEDFMITRTLHHLGYLEAMSGDLDRARDWYRRTLSIQEEFWGPTHHVNAHTLYQLACIAALDGRPEQALDLLRNALDCGFDSEQVFTDEDLAGLRGMPEFDAIATEVRRRRGSRRSAAR